MYNLWCGENIVCALGHIHAQNKTQRVDISKTHAVWDLHNDYDLWPPLYVW